MRKSKIHILGNLFPKWREVRQAWVDKINFYKALHDFAKKERENGAKVIFTGDVNCAHEPIDLARPKDNNGVIGFHPTERACLSEWVSDGFVDVWRTINPEVKDIYSWWHMISRARDRNVGWRIDYFFVDESLIEQVQKIEYLTDQLGSDHCPVVLEVEE